MNQKLLLQYKNQNYRGVPIDYVAGRR